MNRMARFNGLILLPVLFAFCQARGQNTFEARAEAILQEYAVSAVPGDAPKYGFWYAQANFAKGKIVEGRTVLEQALSTTPGDPPFAYWSCMDAYLRQNARYGAALIGQTRDFMTSFTGYGEGSSQNHQIMLATARYLASEIWDATDFAAGTGFAAEDPTGKQHLLTKMNEWVHNGIIEHDSPIYIMFHLGPMRTLADLAQDQEIKNMARLAFEWIMVNAANEWMEGHLASSSLRNLFPYDAQNEYYETDIALWLYFGGKAPSGFSLAGLPRACFSVGLALSDYRLPPIISGIANTQTSTFLNRESHAIGDEWPLSFHKSTFMDRDRYAVYSQAELPSGQNSGLNQQSQRWGVIWGSTTSASQKSAFWIKHGRKDISKNRAGTTRYEQVLQKDRTLLVVYDIPEGDEYPFAEGFVSPDLSAFIDTPDKIYFHYGNVLIAILSPKEILWNDGNERLRSDHLKNGIVIETARPDRYTGDAAQQLLAFQSEITSEGRLADSDVDGVQPRLVYKSIHGFTLDLTYEGPRRIDAETVDYSTWPLMENPWVGQIAGNDTLRLMMNGETRTYDFKNWVVLEEPGIVLSLEQPASLSGIAVFPNPGKDMLSVKFPNSNRDPVAVSIVNASGNKVYDSIFQIPPRTQRLEIPVHDLVSGIYVLTLTLRNESIDHKVLIRR